MKEDVLFWAAIVWFFCMCVAAIWVLIQPVTRLGESQPKPPNRTRRGHLPSPQRMKSPISNLRTRRAELARALKATFAGRGAIRGRTHPYAVPAWLLPNGSEWWLTPDDIWVKVFATPRGCALLLPDCAELD